MVNRVRAAIIGTGMIAAIHRRSAVTAGAVVEGVLGSSPRRSAEAGAKWGIPHYSGLNELLEDAPDIVHICSPNSTHADYVRALVAEGIAVICEKPLGMSAGEARELRDLARSAGVVATVPFVYRYHPTVREIRARAEAGEFGEWVLLHGSYLQDWLLNPRNSNWRVDPTTGGASRAVADIGSHWFDLVEWVSGVTFDEVMSVLSIAFDSRPGLGGESFAHQNGEAGVLARVFTEDSAVVLLRAGSLIGSTTISQVSAGRKNRLWFELDGSRGSAVFDQENPESIWLGDDSGARILVRGAGASVEEQRLSQLPPGHAQGYQQCFDAFVNDTYAALEGDIREGLPTFDDGLRAAEFVEAVLSSAHDKRWTRIASGE